MNEFRNEPAALACGLLAAALTFPSAGLAQRPAGWHDPQATLRFELNVSQRPSHAAAGFLVDIPDGGLLPEPAVETRVFSAAGTPVESRTLWHNPAGSLTLIIADPGDARTFTVYVQPARQYRLWTPDSGLAPGPVLVTDPTQASLSAAAALAGLGRVHPAIHSIRKAGVEQAPLSIGGDETGRPRPASFYLLAHLVSSDPGRTWVAPFTLDGTGEVRINGRTITPRERIDKWGGTGDWAEIAPGPNRLEVLHAAPGTADFFTRQTGGLMYLTWRTPNATMQELGGVRSDAVAMPGTSRLETRLLQAREIMRSGEATLQRAETQDGRPVAIIGHTGGKPYWFGDEPPLLVYTFEARAPAASTHYTWTFPGGITMTGPQADWILPGFQEHQVMLTARNAAGETSTRYRLYGFSTRRTSLDQAGDRRDFRRALRLMAEAVPPGHRAVTDWNPAIWRTLLRTAEPGKGTPLLQALFTRHPEALKRQLALHELEALQDLFLDAIVRINDRDAMEWVRHFLTATVEPRRREELTIRAAEIYMHYRNEPDAAEQILRSVLRREQTDTQRFLHIRLGDLALLRGDLNQATRHYADVQNHSRIRRSVADRHVASEAGGTLTGRPLIGATMDRARSDDWKLQALVDASASESIRSLLDQGHLLEAREMLRLWERDLPLSKISADFIILESRFYRALDDPVRAVSMLRAFCETVEASNALPGAAPLLLTLMREAGEAPETIRRHGQRLRKMLEFHPVAEDLDRLMRQLPATAVARKEVLPDE